MSAATGRPQTGRSVLVVGAHGALGSEVARTCARQGAQVVLLGRRVPKLGQVYDQLVADGSPQPAIYPLDLEGATPADYAQLADTLAAELGGLHAVFHAAAQFKGLASIENTEPLDLVRALHINLTAPLLLSRALLPLLRSSAAASARPSSLVFTLEDLDRVSRAYWGGYGVAKHGLEGALHILAQELEGGPVRVHGFRPGPTRSNLRACAYFAEDPGQWPPAAQHAPLCAELLAGLPAGRHGEIIAA
jgi:NAD(P)-dependent dehydrogenase (short-subunit alcohol dehydrogenase family)